MSTVALVWLLLAPGTAILLSCTWRELTASRLVVAVLLVSTAYLAVIGLALGLAGRFSLQALLIMTLPPLLAAAARHRTVRASLAKLVVDRDLALIGVVCLPFLLLVATSPHWNFLLAPNLDAGNYEVYGNALATHGRFGIDVGALRAEGAPDAWLDGGNTWYERPGDTWQPAYLYSYSVLLGVVKVSAGVTAGWLLNALLGALGLGILTLLARQHLDDQRLAGALASLAGLSFAYLLYSKQLMSEMAGLVAVAAIVWILLDRPLRHERWPAAIFLAAATALALGTRLDSFQILAAIAAGTAIAAVVGDRDRSSTVMYGGAIGALLGTGLVVLATAPRYYVPKGQVAQVVPQLAGTPLAGISLLIPVGVFIALCWLVVAFLSGPAAAWTAPSWLNRLLGATSCGVVAALFALAAWTLTLRWQGVTLTDHHDAWNMLRLLLFFPPPLVLATFLAAGLHLRDRGRDRWIPLALTCAAALVVLNSRHSPADIWWMRRYLVVLVPVAILTAAAALEALRQRRSQALWAIVGAVVAASYWVRHLVAVRTELPAVPLNWTKEIALVAAGAAIVLALREYLGRTTAHSAWFSGTALVGVTAVAFFELGWAVPVLSGTQNARLSDDLQQLEALLPDDAIVVVVGDERLLRGMATVLRSVHEGSFLLNVPPDELTRAIALGQNVETNDQPVRVIRTVEASEVTTPLCPIATAEYEAAWPDATRQILLSEPRERFLALEILEPGTC